MDGSVQPRATGRVGWAVFAKLSVTALLLGVLVTHASPADIAKRLSSVGAKPVLAAICLLLLAFVAVGVRWRIILQHFGATARLGDTVRLSMVGGFFNQVLPSGMGGDAFRVWYARGFELSTGRAIASVLVDRMFGLFAITAIVLAGTPFVLWMSVPGPVMTAAALAMALLITGIIAFLSFDIFEQPLVRLLQNIAPRRFLAFALRGVVGAAWSARRGRAMLRAWPSGAMALSISIVCQLLVGAAVFLLLRDLGQPVSLVTVVFLFTFVQLVSMLPISFAGWGLREGGMVLAFRFAGVPAEDALGASILFGICQLGSSLPGAVIWLGLQRTLRMPGSRSRGHDV